MVQALVELDEKTNRVLNVVKARFGLKDKAKAIQIVVKKYMEEYEPELKKEFIEKIKNLERKGKMIRVEDFDERYGLKKHVRYQHRTRSR